MASYSVFITMAATFCSAIGLLGIICARCGKLHTLASWGKRAFLVTMIATGAGSLLAASHPSDSLPFVGLVFAGLVIAMVWEGPAQQASKQWLPDRA